MRSILIISTIAPYKAIPVRQAMEVVGGMGEFINVIRSAKQRNSLLKMDLTTTMSTAFSDECLYGWNGKITSSSELNSLRLLSLLSIGNLVTLIIQTCSRRHRRNHNEE
jgi:hypothetical protein